MERQGAARWTRAAGMLLLALQLVVSASAALAQDDENCKDFASQPEAQNSLNMSYPEDPDGLDADGDWIACEDFFGLSEKEARQVIPADKVNQASNSASDTDGIDPLDGTPPDTSTPAPASEPATTTSAVDVPAEIMARVEKCEVITVSTRSVAAAGCPGVGTIIERLPAGSPRMRPRVIIHPGAALVRDEPPSPARSVSTGSDDGRRGARGNSSGSSGNAGRSGNSDEADTSGGKNKNKKGKKQKAKRAHRAAAADSTATDSSSDE